MRKILFTAVATVAMASQPLGAFAQGIETKPFLASLFSDNMVLQRDIPAPVWGWAKPGTSVTVRIAGKTATTTADANGKWIAKLPPLTVGGPYTLAVSGPETITRTNVLVGDVWVCSGQSNMQMGIGIAADAEKEIANANYPQIRLFNVPNVAALSPTETVVGTWSVCSPQTIATKGNWGGFSATAYYFGRTLNKELNVPIGLIHTSWGGTIAEAWVSGDALKKNMPDFVNAVSQVEASAALVKPESYDKKVAEWFATNDPGSRTGSQWETPGFDDSVWKTIPVPGAIENSVLPNFDGIVWLRKEVTIPATLAGKDATLNLGAIDDSDKTWVNGTLVGATDGYNVERSYKVPGNILKAGKNVIVVRVLDTGGAGGMTGGPETVNLTFAGTPPLPLAGSDWKFNASADFKKSSVFPIKVDNNPNVTTVLYNGMISPLVPYGIKGAIWYQGESNAGRDEQYSRLLPTLINDWRARFGVGAFPFYIVQLASFMQQDATPKDDGWPRLREAQFTTTKKVTNTGIATAIDIGEANDIHPKNKQEVGRRLALNALALTYGQKIEYSGPVYKDMKADGNTIRIRFEHATGLATKGGEPVKGFAIAGADKKFVWANAKIVGDSVIVSAPGVSTPTAVRYAWANNPVCNLINKAQLPALPFRTDTP